MAKNTLAFKVCCPCSTTLLRVLSLPHFSVTSQRNLPSSTRRAYSVLYHCENKTSRGFSWISLEKALPSNIPENEGRARRNSKKWTTYPYKPQSKCTLDISSLLSCPSSLLDVLLHQTLLACLLPLCFRSENSFLREGQEPDSAISGSKCTFSKCTVWLSLFATVLWCYFMWML